MKLNLTMSTMNSSKKGLSIPAELLSWSVEWYTGKPPKEGVYLVTMQSGNVGLAEYREPSSTGDVKNDRWDTYVKAWFPTPEPYTGVV